jgi:hypothetical protein
MAARTRKTVLDPAPVIDTALGAIPEVTAAQFAESFGEGWEDALNLDSWRCGVDLAQEYHRIETEIREAVHNESSYQTQIRERVFPKLAWDGAKAPRGAGAYPPVSADEIRTIHQQLLFSGGVEACDGTTEVHDTLPLTIYQIGVSLVSYAGNQGTWHQRLFRRDLRFHNADPINEVLELLERRGRRGGLNQPGTGERFSELFQRAVMAHAERAILLRHSTAAWRMGHGSPTPLELLTGGGLTDLMIVATRTIRDLVLGQQKFVFVASEPAERMLGTIGQALQPYEFAIVLSLNERIETLLKNSTFTTSAAVDTHWDGVSLSPAKWIRRFIDDVASQIVVGVFRASPLAPPQIFYAHVDHADVAARIAIADSALVPQRGFPMLIDLADRVCASVYGSGGLNQMAANAYAGAGVPFRYLSERQTRNR